MKINLTVVFSLLSYLAINNLLAQDYHYPWLNETTIEITHRIKDIPPPDGFEHKNYPPNTFPDWLQNLPLKENSDKVRLFDGSLKSNQNAHYKIINIDVGNTDLQQCADAVIRLYAEFLYSQKRYDEIAFNFTNGDRAAYSYWINGYRPIIHANDISWTQSAKIDQSYNSFRQYLKMVFTFAGSYSLSKELHCVDDLSQIEIGDVFIQGDFPGHAIIVADMAIHHLTHQKLIMLAQSYMPAQELHILKNCADNNLSPWYEIGVSENLFTPEWIFNWTDLKRFPLHIE